MKKYDVVGIGSALMDFLIEIDDKELLELDLKKGEMHLIDEDHSKKIFDKLKHYDVKIAPGGSSDVFEIDFDFKDAVLFEPGIIVFLTQEDELLLMEQEKSGDTEELTQKD